MSLFATPRASSSTGARRTLELATGLTSRTSVSTNRAEHRESPIPVSDNNSSSAEMMRVLKDLQQQVSALQAQQNQLVAEKTSPPPASSVTSPQEKRKLPKELTVSY